MGTRFKTTKGLRSLNFRNFVKRSEMASLILNKDVQTLAATGNTQNNAALITLDYITITGADGTKGVRLPALTSGRAIRLKNNVDAQELKLYPWSGGAINDGTADAPVTITGNGFVTIWGDPENPANWYVRTGKGTMEIIAEETSNIFTLDEQDFEVQGEGSNKQLFTLVNSADAAATLTVGGTTFAITAGANTFLLEAGSSSLDIATAIDVNIDKNLTVNGSFGTILASEGQENTLTLNENLTIGDGYAVSITALVVAGSIVLDEQTFEVEGEGSNTQLLKLINSADAAATLTITGTAGAVNQDTRTTASPAFIGVTLTPAADTVPITITGTNMTSVSSIDINLIGMVSGSIIDIDSGTSVLTGSFTGIKTVISNAHDGTHADTLIGNHIVWTGDIPNGTANSNLYLTKMLWQGRIGLNGAEGGSINGWDIEFTGTLDGSAVDLRAINLNLSGIVRTSANSVYGIYIVTDGSTADGALYATDSGPSSVILCDNTNAILAVGPSVLPSITSIPLTNIDVWTVTGTNMTNAAVINVDLVAMIGGTVMDIVSGTSILTGSFAVYNTTVSNAHDGVSADTLVGNQITWSGNVPNDTLDSNMRLSSVIYSGTWGSGGTEGGNLMGFSVDFTTATINGSAANVYGVYVSTAGLIRTSANSVYGVYSLVDATDDAAIFASDGTLTVALANGTNAIAAVGNILITGTGVEGAHLFNLTGLVLTTGSIFDIAEITTKTSGYLYNGSMTTSVLDASTLLDDFSVSCNHDGLEANVIRGMRRVWSGDFPNGTAAVDFIMFEAVLSSTVGTAAGTGGTYNGFVVDLGGVKLDDVSLTAYGFFANLVGIDNTSSARLYGMCSIVDSAADAAICAQSTDPGALGAVLDLVHNSSGTAVNDVLGRINFRGNDDSAALDMLLQYAYIDGIILDDGNGAIFGGIEFYVDNGTGALVSVLKLEDDGGNSILTMGSGSNPGLLKDGGTVGDGEAFAYTNIKTLKYTIGAYGVANVNYNTPNNADKTEENIQLGAGDIIPGYSRVLDITIACTTKWEDTGVNGETMGTTVGTATSGTEYLASANIDDVTDINSFAADSLGHIQTTVAATSVWIGLTPTTYDWADIDAGITTVYITYIDNSAVN